ncbi:MAG: MerR family transcriptional regulator [Myxococcales bacterium]|nr:MerR family transcriptional regulator [Myxococcales bacterium]
MGQRGATNGARSGYSIRVASRLTGLSSDTLRMWERRYGFPNPERNAAGVRMYSQEHVERLMLVARSLKAGYRAGEVVSRTHDELSALLASTATTGQDSAPASSSIEALIGCLERDDVASLQIELRQRANLLGAQRFIKEVCAPLLERVGDAWASHKLEVRHEHLLSRMLSTQLRVMSSAYEGATSDPVVLLATLPGERHGLGLDMAALYLALSGATPRVLGIDTPADQIAQAARHANARVVGLSVSASAELESVRDGVEWMFGALSPGTWIWLGGKHSKNVALEHPRLERITRFEDLDLALDRVVRARD